MSADSFADIDAHVGHHIEAVTYGRHDADPADDDWAVNASIECEDCHEVLLDFDREEPEDDD